MTTGYRGVVSTRLDFYTPSGAFRGSLSSEVEHFDITEQSDKSADTLNASIVNQSGAAYSKADLDDEVRVYAQRAGDASLAHIWTGIVTDYDPEPSTKTVGRLVLAASDYVFQLLIDREATYSYDSTDAGAAIIDVCNTFAPEIDTSAISSSIGTNVTIRGTGQTLLEAVREIARRAQCTLTSDKNKKLYVIPTSSLSSGVTVDYTKVGAGSLKPKKTRPSANVVRVWGGETIVAGDAQDTVTTTSTVTSTTRKETTFKALKHRVQKLEIYTDPTVTNSGDDVRVRIQADRSGSAVDWSNYDLDLTSKVLSAEFLAIAGWTTFILPDHTLGAGSTYHVAVESTGSGGQAVGVDGSGNLAFKVWHPTPIIVERSDQTSIDAHRKIVKTIRRKQIDTQQEAIDLADSELALSKNSRWDVAFDSVDNALDDVVLGYTVTLDFTRDSITGSFVVTQKRHTYDAESRSYACSIVTTQNDTTPTLSAALQAITNRLASVEDAVIGKNNTFLTDFFRSFTETLRMSDSVAQTTQTTGTFTVDVAKVGFSDVA